MTAVNRLTLRSTSRSYHRSIRLLQSRMCGTFCARVFRRISPVRRFAARGVLIRRSAISLGLSENAWDFTDPNAIPGFGPLEATDDVRKMVEQIMSRVGEASPQTSEQPGERRKQDTRISTTSQHQNVVTLSQSDIVGNVAELEDGGIWCSARCSASRYCAATQ